MNPIFVGTAEELLKDLPELTIEELLVLQEKDLQDSTKQLESEECGYQKE